MIAHLTRTRACAQLPNSSASKADLQRVQEQIHHTLLASVMRLLTTLDLSYGSEDQKQQPARPSVRRTRTRAAPCRGALLHVGCSAGRECRRPSGRCGQLAVGRLRGGRRASADRALHAVGGREQRLACAARESRVQDVRMFTNMVEFLRLFMLGPAACGISVDLPWNDLMVTRTRPYAAPSSV
jgi:hypothetical protein